MSNAQTLRTIHAALDLAAKYVRLQNAPWSPTVQREDLMVVEQAIASMQTIRAESQGVTAEEKAAVLEGLAFMSVDHLGGAV